MTVENYRFLFWVPRPYAAVLTVALVPNMLSMSLPYKEVESLSSHKEGATRPKRARGLGGGAGRVGWWRVDHRCRAQDDHDGGKDERRWKHFYEQRKINNFGSLPASQKMAITLTSHPDPMIDAPHKSRA